jgi:purine-binding chemotaxis protein CheW
MSTNLPVKSAGGHLVVQAATEYVTMSVADQPFGIPVLEVRDVLSQQRLTRIPLSPREVAGSLNLRGRIVTAIDMRARLDLPPRPADKMGMNVVVDYKGELYSLIVDKVGEVMALPPADYEKNPATLDQRWQSVSNGIFRLKESLLVVLDTTRLMDIGQGATA